MMPCDIDVISWCVDTYPPLATTHKHI